MKRSCEFLNRQQDLFPTTLVIAHRPRPTVAQLTAAERAAGMAQARCLALTGLIEVYEQLSNGGATQMAPSRQAGRRAARQRRSRR